MLRQVDSAFSMKSDQTSILGLQLIRGESRVYRKLTVPNLTTR